MLSQYMKFGIYGKRKTIPLNTHADILRGAKGVNWYESSLMFKL